MGVVNRESIAGGKAGDDEGSSFQEKKLSLLQRKMTRGRGRRRKKALKEVKT